MTVESATEWRIRYEKHVRSARWRNMRADLIKLRGAKCERCGRSTQIELHHKTYKRLGRELMSDLSLLCEPCHIDADNARKVKSQEARERARYDRALNTFAQKMVGEDWRDRLDCDEIAERFDRWRERKDEE